MAVCGSWVLYFFATVVLTTGAMLNAWTEKQQFYTAVNYMTSNKINVLILGNFTFMLLVALGAMVQKLFLGTLDREEKEELLLNAKYAITETCLALTTFRDELDWRVLILFTVHTDILHVYV